MDTRFENFAIQTTRITRTIQRIKDSEMARFGLKGVHVMCLVQLAENPQGVTATELANLCSEDKAAISRALRKLEDEGMISREGGTGSVGYRSQITLTDKGKEVSCKISTRIGEFVAEAIEDIEEERLAEFRGVLCSIADNLEEKWGK